jgi:hypothetical protein
MANKNTLQKRRMMEKTYKRGVALVTFNNNRWKGEKVANYNEVVAEIRETTKRLYGRSA